MAIRHGDCGYGSYDPHCDVFGLHDRTMREHGLTAVCTKYSLARSDLLSRTEEQAAKQPASAPLPTPRQPRSQRKRSLHGHTGILRAPRPQPSAFFLTGPSRCHLLRSPIQKEKGKKRPEALATPLYPNVLFLSRNAAIETFSQGR